MFKLFIKIIIFVLFTSIPGKAAVTPYQSNFQGETSDSSDRFINGWEYKLVQAENGHPFAFSKVWQYGTINSELGKRDDLLMNYDVYQDVLVIQVFSNDRPHHIILNPRYINSFELDGHKFFNPDFVFEQVIGSGGYFEMVYDADIKFFVKRIKNYREGDGLDGSSYTFDKEMYIFLNGDIYPLKNRRTLFRLFPQSRKDIAKFLRRNQINLKTNDLSGLRDLMKYLETLAKNE